MQQILNPQIIKTKSKYPTCNMCNSGNIVWKDFCPGSVSVLVKNGNKSKITKEAISINLCYKCLENLTKSDPTSWGKELKRLQEKINVCIKCKQHFLFKFSTQEKCGRCFYNG